MKLARLTLPGPAVAMVAGCLVVFMLVLGACGGGSDGERSEEAASQLEEGIESAANVRLLSSLPDSFPSAVPLYPKADVVRAIEYSGSPKAYLLELRTNDGSKAVEQFYEDRLSAEGLDSEGSFGGQPNNQLYASADLSVTVSAQSDRADPSTTLIRIVAVEGNMVP